MEPSGFCESSASVSRCISTQDLKELFPWFQWFSFQVGPVEGKKKKNPAANATFP